VKSFALAAKEGNVITFQFGLASSLIWYDMIGCQHSATRLKFDQNKRLLMPSCYPQDPIDFQSQDGHRPEAISPGNHQKDRQSAFKEEC
jgi:hypothetical protein